MADQSTTSTALPTVHFAYMYWTGPPGTLMTFLPSQADVTAASVLVSEVMKVSETAASSFLASQRAGDSRYTSAAPQNDTMRGCLVDAVKKHGLAIEVGQEVTAIDLRQEGRYELRPAESSSRSPGDSEDAFFKRMARGL